MSASSDPPKTPSGGPPKRGGGVRGLAAMFEQGGGSPGPSSGPATPDSAFKPKPIGRVKTNFVAVADSSGQLGLKKIENGEISPVKGPGTPTKFAFGGPLGEGLRKWELPKKDTPVETVNGKKEEPKTEEPPKEESKPPVEEKVEQPVEEPKEPAPESIPEVAKEPEPEPAVAEIVPEKESVPDVEEVVKEEVPAPLPKDEPKEEIAEKSPKSNKKGKGKAVSGKAGDSSLTRNTGKGSKSKVGPKSPIEKPAETLILFGKDEPPASPPKDPEPEVKEEPAPEVQTEEPVAEPEIIPEEVKEEILAPVKPEEPEPEPVEPEPTVEVVEAEKPAEEPTHEPAAETTEEVPESTDGAIPVNVVPPTPTHGKAPATAKTSTSRTTALPRAIRSPAAKAAEKKPVTKTSTSTIPKPRSSPLTSTTRATTSTTKSHASKPSVSTPTKSAATAKPTTPAAPPAESTEEAAETTELHDDHPVGTSPNSKKGIRSATGFVKPPPKPATVPIQARSSAYGPTTSSASKSSTSSPVAQPKPQSRAKTPSRLTAPATTRRPNSRVAHSKSPSVSPTRPEHRLHNVRSHSRASMASESTVRPKSQQIDPDFLARLARPTQSSASKVVEKRLNSPPAPTLAKKFGGSQKSSRKTDEDQGSASTRPSMDEERPVFEDNGPRADDEHHEIAPDLTGAGELTATTQS
ncbi:hypothetical protein ABW19_dt0207677 [Dactylella cylindrospora]|nr:hypothetical protein ABW19_dt0207677 [Dactylella cylindrospora]